MARSRNIVISIKLQRGLELGSSLQNCSENMLGIFVSFIVIALRIQKK